MQRGPWPAVCVLLALLLVARSNAALAQAPAAPAANRVALTSAATPEEAAGLELVVRELLGRLGVSVTAARVARLDPRAVLTPQGTDPGATARVWIEAQPTRATVYIVDGPWERVLVEHLPLPSGRLDEVAREQIGHLVQSGVEALIAGRRIGFERARVQVSLGLGAPVAPPRAAPAPARVTSPARPTRAARFDLGVFYEAQALWGSALVAHGPGVSAAGSLRIGPARVGLMLSGAYRLPIAASSPDAGVRLDQGTFRLQALLESAGPGRFAFRGTLGAGLDAVAIEPRRPAGSAVTLAPSRAIVVPVVRAAAHVALRLAGRTRVLLGAAIELDPVAPRYVVDDTAPTEVVLAPFPVRPSIQLALETGDLW